MKNVIGAWVTIGLMGLGTAAAATHAARVERAAAEAGRVVRVKRPRQPKPPVPSPPPPVQESVPAIKPGSIKPAPPPSMNTRLLSRVSRRQA